MPGAAAVSADPGTGTVVARRFGRTDVAVADVDRSPAMHVVETVTRFACQSAPDLFFAESPADLEQAKDISRRCPVRCTCLSDALARREPWGVWGGEVLVNGVITARKRPRGRPRKNSASGLAPGNAP